MKTLSSKFARRLALTMMLGSASMVLPATAALAAAPYPNKPIRLLVPFSPGGVSDGSARLVAKAMSEQLGQDIVVENRPGAAGLISGEATVHAEPDGYILLLGYTGLMSVLPFISPRMPYDTLTALAAVGRIGDYPSVLSANTEVKVKDWKDVFALSKKQPGGLFYGTSGSGGMENLIGAMLVQETGAHLVHVPYKGAGPALTDTMGGQIPLTMTSIAGALPHIRAGRLRPIAVSSAERSPSLPDVPTFAEAGVQNIVVTSSVGIIAPGKTPKPIIDILNNALNAALATTKLREGLERLGIDVKPDSPENYRAEIERDYKRFGKVVKASGIKAD